MPLAVWLLLFLSSSSQRPSSLFSVNVAYSVTYLVLSAWSLFMVVCSCAPMFLICVWFVLLYIILIMCAAAQLIHKKHNGLGVRL